MAGIKIAIDRGGTFTDLIANPGTGKREDDVVLKLLSVDPKNYADANLEGIRRILELFQKKNIPRGSPLDLTGVDSIRMGTTLATNCALERNGEPCALLTTKGFEDVLKIGDQSRPQIFDLRIDRLDVLYSIVMEIDERVTMEDFAEDPDQLKTNLQENKDPNLVYGKSGEIIRIIKRPNEKEVLEVLQKIYDTGVRSLAVAFLHSYTFPEHEKLVGDLAEKVGFTHISLSSDISPMIKYVPRTHSSVADAYLTPVIKRYIDTFCMGVKNGTETKIQFMQSDGGLTDANKFSGLKSILSGPAGGVIGVAATSYHKDYPHAYIGLDLGGTSTDICRYSGVLEHVFETITAGITIQSPQLDVKTIAAGGSSMLFFENGLFRVGPDSATSNPGSACYRKGGPLTITDANLFLGRLVPEFFPKIFGPHENEPLDIDIVDKKFSELTETINKELGKNLTADEVAHGFLQVATESMARAIRTLTEAKGHIVADHRLVSLGGAAGQLISFVGESLDIDTILIHRYASILSAYGIFLADVVTEEQEPCSFILEESTAAIESKFQELTKKSLTSLLSEGFEEIKTEKFLNLRYVGTSNPIMVLEQPGVDFKTSFTNLHQKEFGFSYEEKDIIVDDIRVRSVGISHARETPSVDKQLSELEENIVDPKTSACFYKNVFFDGQRDNTPVFKIDDLPLGCTIFGPAILVDNTQTNVVPGSAKATVLEQHIVVQILKKSKNLLQDEDDAIDPVMLSIFGNKFMAIAEAMGNQLRKTAVSTNVKERLDFSCALFDSSGALLSNAPHIPVHLGSLSTCVTFQAKLWEGKLKPGDVIITNHPSCGGTHLPDVTLITPAFKENKVIFYVASRAHHADIGGITVSSMPSNSKYLFEEGAAIYSELIVKEGFFDEEKIRKLFYDIPASYPGCSGSRKLSDNISDLKAQIAANLKGIQLLYNLISTYGLKNVYKYMAGIMENAETTVKAMLNKFAHHYQQSSFYGADYMDDGAIINLHASLDVENEKYTFDFTGSSPQVYANLNAPIAITNSAIIYFLRCLVGENIPLNQGCLSAIKVIAPEGTILNPSNNVAVVGGNVCTSQRITDVLLKTFKVQADSQGCCNNFTFGIDTKLNPDGTLNKAGLGYYETIAGGAGAGADSWRGPGWNGASGVHTNMTNTRMTDPEIFEKRYPVLLKKFCIRKQSGGNGFYKGGDGVIRDIEFRSKLQASILSERRSLAPHGIDGGADGKRGLNLWIRKFDGAVINIGGKNTVDVSPGDRIVIETPGGGAVGKPKN